jgi:hypothetical protein
MELKIQPNSPEYDIYSNSRTSSYPIPLYSALESGHFHITCMLLAYGATKIKLSRKFVDEKGHLSWKRAIIVAGVTVYPLGEKSLLIHRIIRKR